MKGAIVFNRALKSYFNASDGAYSSVTVTESKSKRQYNVKKAQKTLLETFLGNELLRRKGMGGKKSLIERGIPSFTKFKLYPSGEKVDLELVYPKSKGQELRIYFSVEQFAPQPHELLVIFIRNSDLWIGSISDVALRIIESRSDNLPILTGRDENLETEIDQYQDVINDTRIQEQTETRRFAWKRDPKVARNALELNGYVCEMFPSHPTFISRATGKNYLEVHHLVPMKHQAHYSTNLDTIQNMCILGPYGHRLLHHAEFDVLRPHLSRLSRTKKDFLDSINVSVEQLEDIYL